MTIRLDGIPEIGYSDDMATKRTNLAADIRNAMKADGRSVYAFARDTELPVSSVQRFHKGGGANLATASRLCDVLGLELRPIERKGR